MNSFLQVLALVAICCSCTAVETDVLNTVDSLLRTLGSSGLDLPKEFRGADGRLVAVNNDRKLFGELNPVAIPVACNTNNVEVFDAVNQKDRKVKVQVDFTQNPAVDALAADQIGVLSNNVDITMCYRFIFDPSSAVDDIGINTNAAGTGADKASLPVQIPLGSNVQGDITCKNCYANFRGGIEFKVECNLDRAAPENSQCFTTIGAPGFDFNYELDVQKLSISKAKSPSGTSDMTFFESSDITLIEIKAIGENTQSFSLSAAPKMTAYIYGDLNTATSGFSIKSSYKTDYRLYSKCISNGGEPACTNAMYASSAGGNDNRGYAPAVASPTVTGNLNTANLNYDVQFHIESSITFTYVSGPMVYTGNGALGSKSFTRVETPVRAVYSFTKTAAKVSSKTNLVSATKLWMWNMFNAVNYKWQSPMEGNKYFEFSKWVATSFPVGDDTITACLKSVIYGGSNILSNADRAVEGATLGLAQDGIYSVDLAGSPSTSKKNDGSNPPSKELIIIATVVSSVVILALLYFMYTHAERQNMIDAAKIAIRKEFEEGGGKTTSTNPIQGEP